jgi:cell division protein FtsI (penicillin-binding protein 3)
MNRRMVFMLGLAASWLLALSLRLYQLQVVRHEYYRERAEKQQNHLVTLTPPRGTIYDRRGHELAVSVEVMSVAVDPTQVDDHAATAAALSEHLGIPQEKLVRDLASKRAFVWVKRKIDLARAQRIRDLDLAGVLLIPENKRYYPKGSLAAAVLGYVGTDNSGLAGLEYLYNGVVSSEPGQRMVVRDARRGTVLYPSVEVAAAKPGRDLYLTLDATIQYVTERELGRAVKDSGADSGMAVVLDPHTGGIYALASYPTFDPNRFGDFPAENWRNRPVTDAYEPGSTFKMVTVAAALEAAKVTSRDVINCENGGIRLQDTLIKDHSSFGMLTVSQVITHSSNIGAIKIGHLAGRERFFSTIEAFGFGRPTGVDLPSESAGILRPLEKWSALTPAYHSFGQGLSVTALQLANAFAVIANGGRLLKPHIVASFGQDGVGREDAPSGEVVGLPISPSSVKTMRAMLETVVTGGTAKSAAIPGYRAAGKTGTAEKAIPGRGYVANRYIASFVGFAPVDDPVLVAAVILDEPWPRYHGGDVAAPVFRAIAERTLLYLGVRPERAPPSVWPGENRPEATLAAQGEKIPTPPGTLPDFGGFTARQALIQSQRLGIALAMNGHGAVERQLPAPGTPLEATSSSVELWLTTEKM